MLKPSHKLQACFQANPRNFHRRLVPRNKAYIHHAKPESNIQNKEECHSAPSPLVKFKLIAYFGKVIPFFIIVRLFSFFVLVFFLINSEGVILIDYLEKRKKIMDSAMRLTFWKQWWGHICYRRAFRGPGCHILRWDCNARGSFDKVN